MSDHKKLKKASRAHTVYKLENGSRVPSATTVMGLLNKPFLITWANNLGLEGINSSEYRDEAADIGTLAHAMIQAHLSGSEVDFENYSPMQLSLAENAVIKYYEWEKGRKLEPILVEGKLVSEQFKYGGTVDLYCKLDGVYTLVDFKSGKALYNEHFGQLAAYKSLLEEAGHKVDAVHILRVGRDETEGFEERTFKGDDIALQKHFEIFKHLLGVYCLKKELGWR